MAAGTGSGMIVGTAAGGVGLTGRLAIARDEIGTPKPAGCWIGTSGGSDPAGTAADGTAGIRGADEIGTSGGDEMSAGAGAGWA